MYTYGYRKLKLENFNLGLQEFSRHQCLFYRAGHYNAAPFGLIRGINTRLVKMVHVKSNLRFKFI